MNNLKLECACILQANSRKEQPMKPHSYISDLITLDYVGGLAQIPRAELLNVYVDRQYRRIIFFGSKTCSLNFEDIQAISWKENNCYDTVSAVDAHNKNNLSLLAQVETMPTLQISCNTHGRDTDVLLKKKSGLGGLCAGISFALAADAPANFDFKNRPEPQIPKLELSYTIAFWILLAALAFYIISLF